MCVPTEAHKDMEGPQRYLELSRDVSATLQDIGRFLGGLVEGGSDGGHQMLLDQELSSYFQRFYQLKARHQDRALSCAVLALTKSGKSTLLNALLGAICLPSSNVPETARITRIIHTPLKDGKQPELTYQPSSSQEKRTIVGEYGIREHLRYLNREVRTRNHQASDEGFLDVRIPVAALEAFDLDPAAVSLQLLDTPGPNEFGEEALKHQVERLLDGVDAVLYLLDYSKLKTAEEATLLGKLKDINPQLVARLSQRLFFVVNKIDLTRTSEGLDPEEIKHYVASLVTNQLATEGFQLSPDQVLLLSAQDAMLSRLILRGKAGKEERLRFGKLAFGARKAATTPDEDYMQAAEEMLQESGLQELEQRVLGFLCTNSGNLKLLSTLDDAQRLLHQVHNVAAASNAALQQDVKTLQEETEKLTAELEDVLEQFDGLQHEANQVEGEVVDEVRGRMQHLKEDLFEKVAAVLESPDDSPNGQATLRAALAGRWEAALDKTARFWARQRSSSSAARDELQGRLKDLHEDIHATIDAEVRGFWAQLEAATNERQQAMFRMLNVHLARLAQRVETVVGDLLEVELEPVPLHLEPPTAQEFHTDLQQLFSAAISPREVERTREGTEEHLVWEKRTRRTGLCSWSDYYVARPEQRSITESYKETVFELRTEQVMEYFMKLVDDTVEVSVKHVRAFVHQYLSARLNEARSQIEQYGSRYTEAMLHALETSKQGEEARMAGMQAVQQHLAMVTRLLEQTAGLQQRASALLPATDEDEAALLHALMDALHGDAGGSKDAEVNFGLPIADSIPTAGAPMADASAAAATQQEAVSDHGPSEAEDRARAEQRGGGLSMEAAAAGDGVQELLEFEDAHEDLVSPIVDPAAEKAPVTEAEPIAPARRGRMGTGQRNKAMTSALYDPEQEPSTSTTGAAPAFDPAIIQPATVEGMQSANNVHANFLSAIWSTNNGDTTAAGKAAAANIDRVVNPPTAAMAAHEAANSISGFVDMNKWAAMDGFTDSDEEADMLCSCGKVHPPTFHQPWRSAAARSEEAAAPAAAPAAPADPGPGIVMQDAAHLRAPAPEQLPMSSLGPIANTPPVVLAKPLAEHDAHPEHVRSEDASEAGRDIHSHDSSDDWSIVDDTSEAGVEPEAMEI